MWPEGVFSRGLKSGVLIDNYYIQIYGEAYKDAAEFERIDR